MADTQTSQKTQLKIKRPVVKLMLGKWHIKETALMTCGTLRECHAFACIHSS